MTVQIRPGGDAGGRENTATAISQSTPDPDLIDNEATVPCAVEARADVIVAKNASPATATAEQTLTYVLTVNNAQNDLSAACDVTVTDTLPAGLVFLPAAPASGLCAGAPAAGSRTGPGRDSLTCDLGALGNGVQRTVTVRVRPTSALRGTVLTNLADIGTVTVETDATNNGVWLDTPLTDPTLDLLVNKTDSVNPVAVGLDTVYTVTVRNLGLSAAENVVVEDTLPASLLRFQSLAVPANGDRGTRPAVDQVGGSILCTFPTLAVGEQRAITITMRGAAKGIADNVAATRSDESAARFDTNAGNNGAVQRTTVRTRADTEAASNTAVPGTVNLRHTFDFVIRVPNNTGPNLAEADDVQVSDRLPPGRVLTGTPTLRVVSGTAAPRSCGGTAGAGAFTCALGSVSSGAEVEITVPVVVARVPSLPQTLTNVARVTTGSLDVAPDNNANSGPVTVRSSSIAGAVFCDFNDDAARTPGSNTPGSQGGANAAANRIEGITVPANTAAAGYLFARVPQAQVGIARSVRIGPTVAANGSFRATFRLTVRNPSLEALEAITVTDPLAGAAPSFGTPITPGSYTRIGARGGGCGGRNAGFDGGGDTTVASGFTLDPGAACTIDVQIRVQPTAPLPPTRAGGARYVDQATVEAIGALSGQTSAVNWQLIDLSDDGANTDPSRHRPGLRPELRHGDGDRRRGGGRADPRHDRSAGARDGCIGHWHRPHAGCRDRPRDDRDARWGRGNRRERDQ